MLVLLWLRRSLTILMSMPALSASVAQVGWSTRSCHALDRGLDSGEDLDARTDELLGLELALHIRANPGE
jgi:hypothetical protein